MTGKSESQNSKIQYRDEYGSDVLFHPGTDFFEVFRDIAHEFPEDSFYFLNEGVLKRRAEMFQEYFLPGDPRRFISYAVKANPHPRVLEILSAAGINSFDCASPEEISSVQAVDPDSHIFFNNPCKRAKDISDASKKGVSHFTADFQGEVERILENYHGRSIPEVAIRLATPNSKSAAVNLSDKFGASEEEAKSMLLRLRVNSSVESGLSVHVGSQNKNPEAVKIGIQKIVEIAEATRTKLKTFNLGGGFPAFPEKFLSENDSILVEYLKYVSEAFRQEIRNVLRDDAKIIIEPGRGIVAPAVDLVASILNIRQRSGVNSVVVNDGVFTSFSDSPLHHWKYPFRALSSDGQEIIGPKVACEIHGRTCDSGDQIKNQEIPNKLKAGDYLHFPNAGAYLSSQASNFNGFSAHRYVSFNSAKG